MGQMGRRHTMRQLREILRLKYDKELSNAQIARCCGISKGSVAKQVNRLRESGLSWDGLRDHDDAQIRRALYGERSAEGRPRIHAEPDFKAVNRELRRKGVTLQLLWEEYASAHGEAAYSYSQVLCAVSGLGVPSAPANAPNPSGR